MSRSIDLFIDADQPPDEVAAALGLLLGDNLTEDPETGAWLLSHNDVQASLSEHSYEDDGDLTFTRFRYSLSARVAHTVRLQDAPATILLRQISDLAQRRLGWPVLLVMDLQYRDQPADQSGPTNGPAGGVLAPGGGAAGRGDSDLAPAGDLPPGDAETATGPGEGR